jgi:hypothetical protein
LRGAHGSGHLFLGQVRVAPRLDQRGGEGEFLLQRIVSRYVFRVFAPRLECLVPRLPVADT